jgi:hypothetical protein
LVATFNRGNYAAGTQVSYNRATYSALVNQTDLQQKAAGGGYCRRPFYF